MLDVWLWLTVCLLPWVFALFVFGFLAAIILRHVVETRCERADVSSRSPSDGPGSAGSPPSSAGPPNHPTASPST